MKSLLKALIPAALLLLSTASHGFDNNRQGFLFSIGAGLGTAEAGSQFINAGGGPGTSFKIGGGFTNQFTAYYVRNVAWSSPIEDSVGFSGAGASYYLMPGNQSPYLSFAFGFVDVLDTTFYTETGSGLMFGGGFQLSDRVSIEGNYFRGDIDTNNFKPKSLHCRLRYKRTGSSLRP